MNFNSGFRVPSLQFCIVVLVPRLTFTLVLALSMSIAPAGFSRSVFTAQNEPAQPKIEPDAFFSGNVVELSADRVAVSRTILGKAPEKRTFTITPDTKVEGKMKNRSRVTVRYTRSDEGDVALSILVREGSDNKKK